MVCMALITIMVLCVRSQGSLLPILTTIANRVHAHNALFPLRLGRIDAGVKNKPTQSGFEILWLTSVIFSVRWSQNFQHKYEISVRTAKIF